MILYFADIPIRTGNKKPVMKDYAGQKWVKATIYINEKPVDCYFDQRLGANLYFEYNGKWQYLRMSSHYDQKQAYSFNPLNQKVKFKIKNK